MGDAVFHNPLPLHLRALQSVLMRVRPAPLAVLMKQAFGTGRTAIATPRGRFWIDPISVIGFHLSQSGSFDEGVGDEILRNLPTGGVFVDLGANEGYFTVIGALRCGPTGRVISVEPQERLLPVIAENLRLNDVTWVDVLNVAVADAPGHIEINLMPDSGASGRYSRARYSVQTQRVETRTLEQILDSAGIDVVDVMKVDIEGGEYDALLGSPGVIRRHRVRHMILDLHPWLFERDGRSQEDIFSLLKGSGYQWSRDNLDGHVVWHAPTG